MMIKAMHREDKVFILHIQAGSPKDCKELLIIYSDYETGVISYAVGDNELLSSFVVIE